MSTCSQCRWWQPPGDLLQEQTVSESAWIGGRLRPISSTQLVPVQTYPFCTHDPQLHVRQASDGACIYFEQDVS